MATAKTMPLEANVELLPCIHGRGKLEGGGKMVENSQRTHVWNLCDQCVCLPPLSSNKINTTKSGCVATAFAKFRAKTTLKLLLRHSIAHNSG